MPTIKFIDIAVGVTTDRLAKGVKSAQKHLKDFRKDVNQLGGGLLSVGGIAGALGVTLSAGAFAGWIKGAADSIHVLTDFSDQIGGSTEKLMAMQFAAGKVGVEAEGFRKSLAKMNKTLGGTRAGLDDSSGAFATLGLSANALSAMDPSDAFVEIADAISRLPSQSDKAAAAVGIFGKEAGALLPLINGGAAGIKAYAEEAKRLGVAISDVDARKAAAASEAFETLASRVQGVAFTIAAGLAPYVEKAVNSFTELATEGVDVGSAVGTALEWVGKAAGFVADAVHGIGVVFQGMKAAATAAIAFTLDNIAALGKGIEAVLNLIPGFKVEFTSAIDEVRGSLHSLASEQLDGFYKALDSPPPSANIAKFFDSIRAGATAAATAAADAGKKLIGVGDNSVNLASKIQDLVKSLKEQAATFGMNSEEVAIFKLKQEGATDEMLKGVRSLADSVEAKKLGESLKGPREKFKEEIHKINDLFAKGAIDNKTFVLATRKANDELAKGAGPGARAGAFEHGTKEARSAVLAFFDRKSNDPLKGIQKSTEEAVTIAEQQLIALQVIAGVSGKGGGPAGVGVLDMKG